jgi:hypothetical protein
MSQPWACHMLPVDRWDSRTRLTCWVVKVSHGLHGQDTVGLAQLFPQLADGLVRLLLGCAEEPVDPSFEVGESAFE